MVIKRKSINVFLSVYYVFCSVVFLQLKISLCLWALDYGLLKCYRCDSFILPNVSQKILVQLTSEKPLQMGDTIMYH